MPVTQLLPVSDSAAQNPPLGVLPPQSLSCPPGLIQHRPAWRVVWPLRVMGPPFSGRAGEPHSAGKNSFAGTSLVAQWLRICLPMQGTQFKPWSGKISHAAEQLSLCATTTEPTCHNY